MPKSNRFSSQKAGAGEPQENAKQQQQQAQPATPPPATPKTSKGKNQSKIGGTAVQGAKSMQPKELSVGKPAQQQEEYYNREMRRRMQQMKTGPYSENKTLSPRERKKKRQEKLKERQDRMKQLVDAKGPSRDIKLGRKNTYFLIAVGVVVVALIIFAVVKYLVH